MRAPVLIVDDDDDIRESLADALEYAGYEPLEAASGRHALELMRALPDGRPMVILLDMMMPIMDGWEFRAAQLEDADLRYIPVVVLTAHPNAEAIARELGAAALLRKPLELQTLLTTVARFCESCDDGRS